MRANQTLKRYYDFWNKKYFDNLLPHDVKIGYDAKRYASRKRKKEFGEADARKNEIAINPRWRDTKAIVLWALIHEMAHLEEYRRHGRMSDHDEPFEEIMNELGAKGAFSKHNGLRRYSIW